MTKVRSAVAFVVVVGSSSLGCSGSEPRAPSESAAATPTILPPLTPIEEEAELRRALDTYVDVLDSLPSGGLNLDSVAARYDGRARIVAMRPEDDTRRALAWLRQAPTLVCEVLLGTSGSSLRLSPSRRETPTCRGGTEAVIEAALWQYRAAQRMYRVPPRSYDDPGGPPAASVAELDLQLPAGLTATVLTSWRRGHSAIATLDTVPDLVCATWIGRTPAPFRDVPRVGLIPSQGDPACGRDSLLAAKFPGRTLTADTLAVMDQAGFAVGGAHACVIGSDGVLCWGDDRFGQLGDGLALGRTRSARVWTDASLRSIAAGFSHTCALDGTGRALCWGANARGELGDGTFVDRSTPVAVVGPRRFVALVAGPHVSCGLTADGAAYCWGQDRPTPQAVSSPVPFRSLASSFCALSVAEELYCWLPGRSYYWQAPENLGDAVPVTTRERFRVVAEGYEAPRAESHLPIPDLTLQALTGQRACGLTRDNRVWCWDIEEGGARLDSIRPAPVGGAVAFQAVVTGHLHACGLGTDGTAYCWGANDAGQVGDGTTVDRASAVPVRTPSRFRTIAAYGNRTCGITEPDAGVLCWGVTSPTPTPVNVSRDERIRAVATGLPPSVAKDTSAYWGNILPRESRVRFAGAPACGRDSETVREGPDDGAVVEIEFAHPGTSVDDLSEDLSYGWYRIGGFRWRADLGGADVRVPLLDDEGNPTGATGLSEIPLSRARVFRDADSCMVTMVYKEWTYEVFIEVLVGLRWRAAGDSGSAAANERGVTHHRAGRYAEALAEFQRAVALDDGNAEAINNAGFALYRLGRLEESVTWYRRAIEADPDRAVAYLNLGDSVEELGYGDLAREAYERYLELDGDGSAAERIRARIGRD